MRKNQLEFNIDVEFVPIAKGDEGAWRAGVSLLLTLLKEAHELDRRDRIAKEETPQTKTPSCG